MITPVLSHSPSSTPRVELAENRNEHIEKTINESKLSHVCVLVPFFSSTRIMKFHQKKGTFIKRTKHQGYCHKFCVFCMCVVYNIFLCYPTHLQLLNILMDLLLFFPSNKGVSTEMVPEVRKECIK